MARTTLNLTIRVAAGALAALFALASCGGSGNGPETSHFRPHALFRIEPIPNAPAADGVGPHDGFGLRGYPTSDTSPMRVLVFGGAFVYGHGKATKEALPALIEQHLVTLQKSAMVGNAGCPGQCVASAMLRLQFSLYAWKPTHIIYIPGGEDWSVYAASNFQSDLGHVPRPWTSQTFGSESKLSEAGAAALERDLRNLEVISRMNNAKLLLCTPNRAGKLSPLKPVIERVAQKRLLKTAELQNEVELSVKVIAQALVSMK